MWQINFSEVFFFDKQEAFFSAGGNRRRFGPNPAQAGTRAVNKIMERIKEERERQGCGEQEEGQMKMKAAAVKATE